MQQCFSKRIEVFGRDKNKGEVLNQQVRLGTRIVSQYLQHRVVDLKELATFCGPADGVWRLSDQRPVALLGKSQCPFCEEPLGTIQSHTDSPYHRAIRPVQRFYVGLQVAPVHFRNESAALSL